LCRHSRGFRFSEPRCHYQVRHTTDAGDDAEVVSLVTDRGIADSSAAFGFGMTRMNGAVCIRQTLSMQ
jgi:hypothetical protein